MAFQYLRVSEIPTEGLYLDQLRRLISIVGVQGMQVALVRVDGGYSINAFAGQRAQKTFFLKAEKTKERRIFKSPQSAFRICKSLGYDRIVVEL